MANKKLSKKNTAEEVLKRWMKEKNLTIAELSRALGYQSRHLQLILGPTQQRQVTFDLLGRLTYTFGIDSPALDMAEAMKGAK